MEKGVLFVQHLVSVLGSPEFTLEVLEPSEETSHLVKHCAFWMCVSTCNICPNVRYTKYAGTQKNFNF